MQQTNSNSRPTETRRRGFRNLAVVLGVSLLAIGCASLIGIEDRKNETEVEDGLIEDEETMIRTR